MSGVVFPRSCFLHEGYEDTQERSAIALRKYLRYPGLIAFNDSDRSVTFLTE